MDEPGIGAVHNASVTVRSTMMYAWFISPYSLSLSKMRPSMNSWALRPSFWYVNDPSTWP
jgi:hypothetical protein